MDVYQDIKEALESFKNTRVTTNTPFAPLCIYQDIFEEAGYYWVSDWDPNGWQVDFWNDYFNPNTKDIICLSGSLYYGDFKFENQDLDKYDLDFLVEHIDNYAH